MGPPPNVAAATPRSDPRAVASLVLGLASVVFLGVFAGVPAVALGVWARRDVAGRPARGAGLAATGIALGLTGSVAWGIVAGFLLAGAAVTTPAPPLADVPPRVPVAAGMRTYGSLDVVDLDEDAPLREQLDRAAKRAAERRHTLMLQTYVRASRECAELAASLPDRRMQRALANVTLVRVDVDLFEDDLTQLRVDTLTVPWFYKLDARGRPVDAVSADEWDDNVPENIAAVLGPFVRGKLGPRAVPSPLGITL